MLLIATVNLCTKENQQMSLKVCLRECMIQFLFNCFACNCVVFLYYLSKLHTLLDAFSSFFFLSSPPHSSLFPLLSSLPSSLFPFLFSSLHFFLPSSLFPLPFPHICLPCMMMQGDLGGSYFREMELNSPNSFAHLLLF